MTPILRQLSAHPQGISFRKPVTEVIAPRYFEIIKDPMDFSTISKKFDENQYTTPFQFWEDMWLVFNNAWTYNKKSHAVYKAAKHVSRSIFTKVKP
jgi:E1A/CREB-binding protein